MFIPEGLNFHTYQTDLAQSRQKLGTNLENKMLQKWIYPKIQLMKVDLLITHS